MPRLFAVEASATLLRAVSGIVPSSLAVVTTVRADAILSPLGAALTLMVSRIAIKAAPKIVTMGLNVWLWGGSLRI